MHDLILENNVDAVRYSFYRIEEYKKSREIYDKTYEDKIIEKCNLDVFENDLLNNNVQAYLWLLIIKTEKAKQVIFDENLAMMEDTLWYFNFIRKIDNIYFSNKILYNYVVNINSASNSRDKAMNNIQNMLYLQKKYETLFEEKQKQAYTSLLGVIIENIFK